MRSTGRRLRGSDEAGGSPTRSCAPRSRAFDDRRRRPSRPTRERTSPSRKAAAIGVRVPPRLKYDGTELNKRRHELLMSPPAATALDWDGERSSTAQHVARGWLRSKANSIEGGTSEVMLDIVAKRMLDLPGA